MEKYAVSGMSCAACQAHVEKAVSKLPGVTACNVSLLTNSMTVEGSATEAEIVKAVSDAGYGAKKFGAEPNGQSAAARRAVLGLGHPDPADKPGLFFCKFRLRVAGRDQIRLHHCTSYFCRRP